MLVSLHPPRWSGPVHVHFGEDIPDPPAYYPPSQSTATKTARKWASLAKRAEASPILTAEEIDHAR
ncbi:hypothetical protein [Armatimonas sp.]|uniref:hypothetical protein n=1 Tax=Armatimonas sp. TaxID=1872638 RepID=UPI00286B20F9|nr:hypothetical protein [Armatimonas sp.]